MKEPKNLPDIPVYSMETGEQVGSLVYRFRPPSMFTSSSYAFDPASTHVFGPALLSKIAELIETANRKAGL